MRWYLRNFAGVLTFFHDSGIIMTTVLQQIRICLQLITPSTPMPVTLSDIAKHADVSLSTVSRVLNNKDHVSIEARASVLEAIAALGYSRRDLRRDDQAETVLLLIHEGGSLTSPDGTMALEMERSLTASAQAVLHEEGFHVQIVQTSPDRVSTLPSVQNPIGAVNIGGIADRSLLTGFLDQGVPIVIAGSHVRPLPVDCVTIDLHDSMLQVVQHLVERGRRTIGLVNGPPSTTTSRERYLGLRLALSLHDLPFDPCQTVSGNFTFASGDEMTRRLLEQCPDVDAIVYGDDDMAVGGLRALRSLGRQVPGDLSVVGYYDYEIAQFTEPSLTSVAFDKYAMGAVAARRLITLIGSQPQAPHMIVLPTQLRVRSSS